MEITKFKCENEIFAILLGLIVGMVFIFLVNLTDISPFKFMISFYNMIFISQGTLNNFIFSTILLPLIIISAGVVTNFFLSIRNCIFGGITGIFLILSTFIIVYSFGTIYFPILEQLQPIIGVAGIPLVFLIYAFPTAMIGFILGYLGSYIVEHISYYNKQCNIK